MLKVLFVASEGTPFSKTGGLADVIGSLPKAISKNGADVRVVMPLYGTTPEKLKGNMKFIKSKCINVGWRSQYCGIFEYNLNGVIFYLIDNEYYFKRDSIYGYYDEAERYAFFSRAVLDMLPEIDFAPDVIHCHDWQTGMIPVLLEAQYRQYDFYKDVKTLFTIHNIMYQGVFSKSQLYDLFGLGDEYFTSDKLEFNGGINYMKSALVYSNLISTVSPTYAGEVQDPYFGENLYGILRARSHEFTGILNGIDYDEFSPKTDKLIPHTYDEETLDAKAKDKMELQKSLGLEVSSDIPVIGIVSRLTSQKGLDLIDCVIHEIMALDVELVVLGTGDRKYEDLFRNASIQYKNRVSANMTFDNTLAHNIYAGSDIFLMPSLFEPCGLGQIIALKYGSVPIVRETGGLRDTVKPFDELSKVGNGFSFTNYNAHDMLYTINRAVTFFRDKDMWDIIVNNAMRCDFSWDASALKYMELYKRLK